jgi:uncharacterized protein with HEPN domain
MFDREVAIEQLREIEIACDRIVHRISTLEGVDLDDEYSEDTLLRFDSIAMMLIAIGDKLKEIERHATPALFAEYPEIDWGGAKKMRDFIAHGYFLIDYALVHSASTEHIPGLRQAIIAIRRNLERES